ncbi:MAG: hypothetical protein ACYSWO_02660 [Planctomycetota bacterium]
MKICTAFTALAIVLCAGISLGADGLDITFSNDGAVRDGDDYDDVFVYGEATIVDVTGGTIGKLWSRDKSTVNISGGRIVYAQTYDQGTINITGGFVTEPSIWGVDGTINVSGGTCWNVEVSNGQLNLLGGQIAGLGISVPSPGGVINVHGYGFEYHPFPGRSDGRLKGYWADATAFSIDFLRNAYQAVVLHEIHRDFAPVADAGQDRTVLTTVGSIALVTLDGSTSTDPDGDELTYQWTWTLNGNSYIATGPNPMIMLPVGNHTIELVVSDGVTNSKADKVVITVQTLTQQIQAVRASKLKLLEEIDAMLEKEQQMTDALDDLLSGDSQGNAVRDDIIAAKEAINSSMQHQQQAKKDLQKSIENLEDTLLLVPSSEEK